MLVKFVGVGNASMAFKSLDVGLYPLFVINPANSTSSMTNLNFDRSKTIPLSPHNLMYQMVCQNELEISSSQRRESSTQRATRGNP